MSVSHIKRMRRLTAFAAIFSAIVLVICGIKLMMAAIKNIMMVIMTLSAS